MATIEELIKQYETDEDLRKEVADIIADKKITINEFMTFAKKHDVKLSLEDATKYMDQIKKLGLIN